MQSTELTAIEAPFADALVTMAAFMRLGFDPANLHIGLRRAADDDGRVHCYVVLEHRRQHLHYDLGRCDLDDEAFAARAGEAMAAWNASPMPARDALFRDHWTEARSVELLTGLHARGIRWPALGAD